MFYLSKIGKTYQFRLRIPRDLIPHFQQREIRRTLGTTRYREAKTLLHQFTAETERIFALSTPCGEVLLSSQVVVEQRQIHETTGG